LCRCTGKRSPAVVWIAPLGSSVGSTAVRIEGPFVFETHGATQHRMQLSASERIVPSQMTVTATAKTLAMRCMCDHTAQRSGTVTSEQGMRWPLDCLSNCTPQAVIGCCSWRNCKRDYRCLIHKQPENQGTERLHISGELGDTMNMVEWSIFYEMWESVWARLERLETALTSSPHWLMLVGGVVAMIVTASLSGRAASSRCS
jgi:hypothetical protein